MIFNPLKKHIVFIINLVFLFANNVLAQAPWIEWSHTYGGSNLELARQCLLTDDNSYILAGDSFSKDGDVELHYGYAGDADFWILKIDSNQNVIWQKTFGGTDDDYLVGLQQTPDGGYLMVGSVHSTNIQVSFNHGWFDVWVVKIDADGNIEWEKTYGGSESEIARSFTMTSDGGLVIVGSTYSNDGDVTEHFGDNGTMDGWAFKLDTEGNMIWQKSLGGSTTDDLYSVIENENLQYVILGYTHSNDSLVSGNHGGPDVWLAVLSNDGDFLFQQCYGGTLDEYAMTIHQTSDLGYVFCGISKSNDGNVSGHHGASTKFDDWVVKLDSNFVIQWQNSFGGTQDEGIRDIFLKDDGYLFTGSAASIDGDVTSNYGKADMWVVNLDNFGTIQWQKTYGGTDDDFGIGLYPSNDGSYLFFARSASHNVDVPFNNGKEDYWFGKFFIECGIIPELCNGIDENCNGLIDDGIAENITITPLGPTTFCQGGNVTLQAAYSGTSLQWKKDGINIPGETSPTYLVTKKANYSCVTFSDCDTVESAALFVNVIKNPTAVITAGGPTTFCAGGSVTLNVTPVGGAAYQWYKGATAIAGATGTSYVATNNGNYKCRVTKVATGCFKNSNPISVSVPCKEGEILINDIEIYPNPADDVLMVNTNSNTLKSITILNNVGEQVKLLNHSGDVIEINIADLPAGLYVIEIRDGNFYYLNSFIKK